MRGLGTAKTREVVCTHCGGCNEVARRAMSVFCAHCSKRLILEDYNIKSYQAVAGYATCGDVIVHKQGRVAAPIQATNLTVKGTVAGNVRVRGHIEIAPNGVLTGKVYAPSITVSDGARLDAYLEIRPEQPSADVRQAGVINEPAAAEPAAPPAAAVRTTRTRKADAPAAPQPTPPKASAPKPSPAKPPASRSGDAEPVAESADAPAGPKTIKSISTRRRAAPRTS